MKIIFFCGSLEPGRDGVGDYCRSMAAELIKLGNAVKLVALNDRYIEDTLDQNEKFNNVQIDILRFSHRERSKILLEIINKLTNNFQPDYSSLQYVPYAYHIKGLPISLGRFLSKIKNAGKWQAMIHEPFIEASKHQTIKEKFLRQLQIICLRSILKKIRAEVIHTSIPFYMDRLAEQGINSKLLSLFGNIKIVVDINTANTRKIDPSHLKAIYFGSAPEEARQSIFAEKIRIYCEENNAAIEILICGKNGPHGGRFISEIENICRDVSCKILLLGEKNESEISNLFMKSDFGISRNSPEFVEKSGSSISMLEHGLPLWIPITRADTFFSNLKFRPELCFENLSAISQISRGSMCPQLSKITKQFLNDIS
ncbi:MAG: hypothetical protein ABI683_01045 [Ginsengibacter sp.]